MSREADVTGTGPEERARLDIRLTGVVQGVGFRPFVYRLAGEMGVTGRVGNSAQGVRIEAEARRAELEMFLRRLQEEKPPRSSIQRLEVAWLHPLAYERFDIVESDAAGAKTTLVLPDVATCRDCLREIFDPENRRHFYPFTNCTNCGPRFTIIERLPYDRANTSMKAFAMCPQCQAEYEDPLDRRFHAQPNACPMCGPRIELWAANGRSCDTTPGEEVGPAAQRADPRQTGGFTLAHAAGKTGATQWPRTDERSYKILGAAADAIRAGAIVAVKGLGGFHLLVAAHLDESVRRLRQLKHREDKPFALMFPSLSQTQAQCEVSPIEEQLLLSPESPIVLLHRRPAVNDGLQSRPAGQSGIAPSVAPGNPYLGVMLPYTPLHHLLLGLLDFPVVATSGNLAEEPICIDEQETRERLSGIADFFLVHNRPVVRHADDSIVRVMAGRAMVLRRARGYAPLPIQIGAQVRSPKSEVRRAEMGDGRGKIGDRRWEMGEGGSEVEDGSLELGPGGAGVEIAPKPFEHCTIEPGRDAFHRVPDYDRGDGGAVEGVPTGRSPAILAVGAHLKNAVALAVGDQVFISQHIGDLETVQAYGAFERVIGDFQTFYEATPSVVAADAHPDYLSTRFAAQSGKPVASVQHHYAHVLSCMAEHGLDEDVLGVSWDGTGFGSDGTVWGGEFLAITPSSFERVAHWRTFRLPGGERAVREPRRSALGLLYEFLGDSAFERMELEPLRAFSAIELAALRQVLTRKLNAPLTSSAGRLFDAVASLLGLRHKSGFEGQAAMELEFALAPERTEQSYPISFATSSPISAEARRQSCPVESCQPGRVEPLEACSTGPIILDWSQTIRAILEDVQNRLPAGLISGKFHNALAEAIVSVAQKAGRTNIVLSGGCFQNQRLTERAIERLRNAGFRPWWHERVPPNDGGIALGQILAVRRSRP